MDIHGLHLYSGSIDSTITRLYKLSGYERALNEASIEIDTDLIVGVNDTVAMTDLYMDQLRELKDPPTAFLLVMMRLQLV